MKRTVAAVAGSFFLLLASVAHSQADDHAQVMIFGVFHFANPGLDVVQTATMNVMTEENQHYLEGLATRLREFQPTVVLLEFNPVNEASMQADYEQYLDDQFELPANEVFQLGFRIARISGVKRIASFDEASIGWDAEPLFEYLAEHDPKTERAVEMFIEKIAAQQQQAHSGLTLRELLKMTNDADQDRLNKAFYLLTNHAGSGDTLSVRTQLQAGGIETSGCTQKSNVTPPPGSAYWSSEGRGTLLFSRTFLSRRRSR